jgi:hypothetical protein
MRWRWWIPAAVGTLAGALALLSIPQSHLTPPEPLARSLEVARLRAHFDSVDVELRGPQELQLTPGQRTTRATLIGWLREYRDAGVFPQNDRFPGSAVPFFRDSRGVLCAMAYLIDRSGRRDLVDRVASTRNNAYIRELAGDPELRAWLDSVHLSVAEAARIQPEYNGEGGIVDDDQVSAEYAITSILVSGASLTTVGFNLLNPSKSTGWAGLITGGVGLLAGGVKLDEDGGSDQVATINLIIGSGAVAAGLYRLLSSGGTQLDGPAPKSTASNARLAIGPMVVPTSGGTRLGLTLHSTF